MVQRYFWLAYLILITLAAALSANMATSYIGAKLSTPSVQEPTPNHTIAAPPTPVAPVDYAIIAKRNIFNAKPPGDTPAPPPTPPPPEPAEIQETELQLKLVGTVAGGDNQAFAIIEDLKQRGAQMVYRIGDAVQTALLVEIQAKCVVLDEGGRYESLCFPQQDVTDGGAAAKPSSSALPPPPQTGEDGIVRIDNATWRVSRETIEQFSNIGMLSTQARITPYMVQGQPQGFRLTRLKADSILQKIGLRNGDVLQKVNGLSVTSPEDTLRAYQQLQQGGTLRLEILRSNRPTTLTYEIQ
jgi:general secretion pathway protein C